MSGSLVVERVLRVVLELQVVACLRARQTLMEVTSISCRNRVLKSLSRSSDELSAQILRVIKVCSCTSSVIAVDSIQESRCDIVIEHCLLMLVCTRCDERLLSVADTHVRPALRWGLSIIDYRASADLDDHVSVSPALFEVIYWLLCDYFSRWAKSIFLINVMFWTAACHDFVFLMMVRLIILILKRETMTIVVWSVQQGIMMVVMVIISLEIAAFMWDLSIVNHWQKCRSLVTQRYVWLYNHSVSLIYCGVLSRQIVLSLFHL